MQKQFGRSMIEMLGVLALVGVLSIGGIALYRRAVNNHHANTILDDVNRFAFVITEKGGFSTNAFIDNVQYERTSTYNLDAFVGAASGQFGIVVTDVPKGVCEPLVDKANIDYKVRVLPANTAESVEQLSASGLIYDSFNKDICTNDLNDIVLYFGDTSAQCNKPKEGEDYAPCNTNAECCGGSFCAFEKIDCKTKGTGKCKLVSSFNPETETMSDGRTWTRVSGINWWSTQNLCEAMGLKPATRADIGCEDVEYGQKCTESPILQSINTKWKQYGFHWFEDYGNSCHSWLVHFWTKDLAYNRRSDNGNALCH